jgi:8-oxo-dGTP pyrophosphatase MutT (NUDIX family)
VTDPAQAELRSAIADFAPRSDREAASRGRMLAELERLESPFDREADPVHFTGSAVVVGRRGVLLHRHKRLGLWLQPGGHIDPGEQPEQAARREAREETGVEVTHPAGGPVLFHLDVHTAYAGHIHLDLRYLLEGADQAPAPPAGESQAVAWFSIQEAEGLADEGLIDALRRLKGPQGAKSHLLDGRNQGGS